MRSDKSVANEARKDPKDEEGDEVTAVDPESSAVTDDKSAGGLASAGRAHRPRTASLTNRIFLALMAVSVVAVVLAGFASTVVYQGSVQDDAQAQLAREANMLSQVLDRNVAVTPDGGQGEASGQHTADGQGLASSQDGTEGAGEATAQDTAPAQDAASTQDGNSSQDANSAQDAASAQDEASVLAALSLGDLRATLIDDDGTVLYDSDTDAANLPNHADRPEVADALASGSGTIVRQSSTLGYVSIYYAIRLNSGHVLRLSLDRAGVMALLHRDTGMLLVVALVLVGLSWIVAHTLSRRLIRPVINMYPDLQPEVEASPDAGNGAGPGPITLEASSSTVALATAASSSSGPTPAATAVSSSSGATPPSTADESQSLTTVRVVAPYRELEPLTNRINSQRERIAQQFDQLREASVMRSEFTANVTHELKTPLQSISGASELMAEGLVEPEDIPDFARRIYSEARRLTNLVNDILTLSKLDDVERTGSSVYHETTEPVDLFAVAHDVEQRLAPKADDSEVELTLDGDRVRVMGIPRLLDELVYNLVDNAIRYNRPDGYVRVWVGSVAGRPTLRVSDSGIGIAPADQGKIFERFYRVEKSRSRASGGTGLGLAIVKHAATYHHASVDVSSALGKGSTFTVTFPHGV